MNDSQSTNGADWQGVGDSLKDLGRTLKVHADSAQETLKSSTKGTSGIVNQVGTVFKVGLASFDQTVTDPEVGAAAKGATGRFLDALKAQLGAAEPAPNPDSTPPAVASGDDEPPASPPEHA
jgi:hypothetical protein